MREIRLSGSEGGVALIPPSLPLSAVAVARCARGRASRLLIADGAAVLCLSCGIPATRSV